MSQARVKPPSYFPSLDGLRAISFLIVFLAHSGVSLPVPGGFGVTVFFFLSGYLITTLLRIEIDTTGAVSFSKFYLRRALRILPPFYIILGLAVVLSVLGLLPGTLAAAPLAAQALHYSNYWFISHGSSGTPPGTVVYWSLAVEEHFYLLFPFLFHLLTRRLSHARHGLVLWGICGAIGLWRCFLVFGLHVTEDRTYLASDTRFDSILFGCAMAMAMNPVLDARRGSERLWKWVLLPGGLALLLFTFLYRDPWFRETIRYSLQGIGLTPVFVAALSFPSWGPMRLLNLPLASRLGVLSYSLYLVHQVVLFAVEPYLVNYPALATAAIALTLSILVALLLHRFVEEPCASLRRRLSGASLSARRSAGAA